MITAPEPFRGKPPTTVVAATADQSVAATMVHQCELNVLRMSNMVVVKEGNPIPQGKEVLPQPQLHLAGVSQHNVVVDRWNGER